MWIFMRKQKVLYIGYVPFLFHKALAFSIIFVLLTGCDLFESDSSNGLNPTIYDTSNSELPSNSLRFVETTDNAIWVGTSQYISDSDKGLIKFDGSNWTVYNTTNSGLHSTEFSALVEYNNAIWIGTANDGLSVFDGAGWIIYNANNSALPSNKITSLATNEDYLWIGTNDGLARFDGASWEIYNTENSGLPYDRVTSLACNGDHLWIGTTSHTLIKFDLKSKDWKIFTLSHDKLFTAGMSKLSRNHSTDKHLTATFVGIDKNNIAWAGGAYLAKYDGNIWEPLIILPGDDSRAISPFPGRSYTFVLQKNLVWVGIRWHRIPYGNYPVLKRFKGSSARAYNNNKLPFRGVNDLASDGRNVWAATDIGLAKW